MKPCHANYANIASYLVKTAHTEVYVYTLGI